MMRSAIERHGPRARHASGWQGALLATAALLYAAPAAAAETTFDALAAVASRTDLSSELEALVMQCDDEPEGRERRMCEVMLRDRRARARGQSIRVNIEPPRVTLLGKRGWRVTLTGCLACTDPPVLAGMPRRLTATAPLPPRPPPAAHRSPTKGEPPAAAAVRLASLAEIVVPDPGVAERPVVEASLRRLRAEAIVSLKAPRTWSQGEIHGVAIETVAWRVVDPCSGKVYISRPPSSIQLPLTDDPVCMVGKKPAPPPPPTPVLPERLTARHVEQALAPVRVRARACFQRLRVRGRIDLGLDVRPDGTVKMVRSSGPLVDTPSAECVRGAALRVRFPAFRAHTSMHITYTVMLR